MRVSILFNQAAGSRLTGVAADGGAVVRAEALAALVSTGTISLDPPQLNAIRYTATLSYELRVRAFI